MVLVEDVTNSNTDSPPKTEQQSTNNTTDANAGTTNGGGFVAFFLQDKMASILFLTRLMTIAFTLCFIFPFFGYDTTTLYQKALMASAATSALKLHQRMTGVPFQLNREYFARLIIEDSFHYLLYSLIFMNIYPITIVLMPITAFAMLHVSTFMRNLLNASTRQGSFTIVRKGIDTVLSKDKDLMRFIAVNEIILGPTIIVLIISGKCGIFVPFIFYRFICMRYQSRRNPYNRIMFYELRVGLEQLSANQKCPQICSRGISSLIALISRFAPAPNQM